MKNEKILNSTLIAAIATLGHTEYCVIADAGLPVPDGVKLIDLSVVRGVPSFIDVLKAVKDELVIESFIYALELPERNKAVYEQMNDIMKNQPGRCVPHGGFKKLTEKARVIIRTGECSPFANVILIGGVNF